VIEFLLPGLGRADVADPTGTRCHQALFTAGSNTMAKKEVSKKRFAQ
jgi:hypothetical protein